MNSHGLSRRFRVDFSYFNIDFASLKEASSLCDAMAHRWQLDLMFLMGHLLVGWLVGHFLARATIRKIFKQLALIFVFELAMGLT